MIADALYKPDFLRVLLPFVLFLGACLMVLNEDVGHATADFLESSSQIADGSPVTIESYSIHVGGLPKEPIAIRYSGPAESVAIRLNSSDMPLQISHRSPSVLLPSIGETISAEVPANYFFPGENTIDIVAEGSPTSNGIVSLGTLDALQYALNTQQEIEAIVVWVALAFGMIGALIALIGMSLGRRVKEYCAPLWLAVTVIAISYLSIKDAGALLGSSSPTLAFLIIVSQAFALMTLCVEHWQAGERDRVYTVTLAFASVALALTLATYGFGSGIFPYAILFSASLVGLVPLIVYRCARLGVEDFLIFRRTVSDLQSAVSLQATKLDENSRTIANEMMRNAILEERQRMMRDIHDGIGSQLLSLMLRVKSGKISSAETSSGIKESLTDLRLVVDSADHLGGDLAAALTTFRSRAQQQLNAAGIHFHWSMDEHLLGRFVSNGKMLEIFRFMQEALSNIIHHSRARNAFVSVSYRASERILLLEVYDDGIGLPPEGKRGIGKGLRNLAKRAERLDAAYSIASRNRESGTIVTLALNEATFAATSGLHPDPAHL